MFRPAQRRSFVAACGRLWLAAACIAALAATAWAGEAGGGGADCCDACGARRPCPPRSLWMISSLNASACCFEPWRLEYFVHECGRGWVESTLEAYLAADDPAVGTGFFVNGFLPEGNLSEEEIFEQNTDFAWQVRRRMSPRDRPTRLVVWTWPANRPPGTWIVEGAREVNDCADRQARYLAWVIDRMHPDVPVGMLGYSLGAPVVTGTLHVLAGGAIDGRALDPRLHPLRRAPRGALMGAAMPNTWLSPGRRHELAVPGAERLLITVNPRENVLLYYRRFEIGGGATALGNTGIPGTYGRSDETAHVDHFPVERYNGRRHAFEIYIDQPEIMARMTDYLFPPPHVEFELAWPAALATDQP